MSQSNTSKTITIIGNVGAGKTSVLPVIQEVLDAQIIQADDLFQTKNPFREVYLENQERWAFTNELWMTLERAELLKEQSAQANKDWVIVDSGLLMSWVYTYSHLEMGKINKDEWELYSRLFDKFSKNVQIDVVISLRYTIPTLMKRIKQRGRDYELEFYNQEYLSQLDKGLDALEPKLETTGTKLIRIDESEVADFVNNQSDKTKISSTFAQLV